MRELLREYMDYSDINTVRQLSLLSEANQNQFLVSLTSRLYDKIQEKATKIDFSTVELSRGDITKIQNYNSIVECLDIIKKIVIEYKQDPAPVDTVIKAVDNLRERNRLFKKAFAMGTSLPILIYNTTALSIVEATSFLISVCIEYVKDPAVETFQMALDITAYQKTKQNLLFTTLGEFNKSCADRSLDNAINLVLSQVVANREAADIEFVKQDRIEQDHPFMTDEEIESGNTSVVLDNDKQAVKEGSIGNFFSYHGMKILLWICKTFIPVIRYIVYWHYLHKQKKSDYYTDQANMLQMNIMNLQYRDDIPEQQKREIITRQTKIAERYRKRSSELSIDYMVAKKGADKLINEEAKKFKAEEIQDDTTDMSNYASIFEAVMNDDIGKLVFESPFEAATIEDRAEYFEEGFLKKATVGFKINSGVDIIKVYKAHKHEKMLAYVNKCKDPDMLQYIKKDTQTGKSQLDKIKERIAAVEKDPKINKAWAGNIKKMYIDKGVKSSDIEAYENWLSKELIPTINQKIKEIK